MTGSERHPEGWISVVVPPEKEERAKAIRAERDLRYGNIFQENRSDERWVGDLAEMVFRSWLKHEGVSDFKWVVDESAGKPDFILHGTIRIGVKAVKRKVRPRLGYTAQITARHAAEPIEHYFFLTYEIAERRMWLLGGIEQSRFLREARFYTAGEYVHANYQIREGHEIYNIEVERLIAPAAWLSGLTDLR